MHVCLGDPFCHILQVPKQNLHDKALASIDTLHQTYTRQIAQ